MDQQTSVPAVVYSRFAPALTVTIRAARQADLELLEWGGMFAEHRQLIARAWESSRSGTAAMLVADANHYPVGQIWIDLLRGGRGAALLWAVRVLPAMQRLGIGSRLLDAAEMLVLDEGRRETEIRVEPGNPSARRLYERCGYVVRGRMTECFEYTRPDGEVVSSCVHLWRMRKPLAMLARA
jgi:GNAT superfamily N-acetyltransferase